MFKRGIIVFIFLLIFIIGNKFWDFYDRESSKFEDSVVGQPKTLGGAPSIESNSIQPDLVLAPEADLLENALEIGMLGNSPVLQDLTLGFASAGVMKEFINSAERNGIEIIDRMDSLNTVRFAVTDLGKASRYFDELKEDVEPQYNYRVRTPELPRPEFLEGEKNFGANADKWMGTPEERRDWGSGVKVAILDSGIDHTQDLAIGIVIVTHARHIV